MGQVVQRSCCSSCVEPPAVPRPGAPLPVYDEVRQVPSIPTWTHDLAEKLQETVDRSVDTAGTSLSGLEFSFTIADPLLDDCPLIGCSQGFTKLCGYELQDIVGRNCRFLVEGVPPELIDSDTRKQTKDFCESVRRGKEYRRPVTTSDRDSWMPQDRPSNEILAMQTNVRKDGTHFNNMFYMKVIGLSKNLGKERPYIVGLQSELTEGKEDLERLAKNVKQLEDKMVKVMGELAGLFFMQSNISRQLHATPFVSSLPDSNTSGPGKQNHGHQEGKRHAMHLESVSAKLEKLEARRDQDKNIVYAAAANIDSTLFAADVEPWEEGRFVRVRKLADASRNRGAVWLMRDRCHGDIVAVKQMPNSWMRHCHKDFLRTYPGQQEQPWLDIGITRFLNSVNYDHACDLRGVFRNFQHTFVVSSFASQGDLYAAATDGKSPGPERESRFAPLMLELFSALRWLHEMHIVHRDISLENVVQDSRNRIKIIDYGQASTKRTFRKCPRGKASYEAPEMLTDPDYDAFLSDTFALGVVVFSVVLGDYPWWSTRPGRCTCFDYVKESGLRSFCTTRRVRGENRRMIDCISEPIFQLLQGLLTIDPKQRLTLGEQQWEDRKSVWDLPWTKRWKQTPLVSL